MILPQNKLPLSVLGTSFYDASGRRLTYAGFADYSLLSRFCRREDITPILNQRVSLYEETKNAPFLRSIRILGMMEKIVHFNPKEFPNYYTDIEALVDFLYHDFGFCVQFDVFADAQYIMPQKFDQLVHWDNVCQRLARHPSALITCGNEWRQNGFYPGDFNQITNNNLYSRGSDVGDANPFLPTWDFSLYHGRRDDLKGELSSTSLSFAIHGWSEGNVSYAGTHQPTIHDEALPCGDNYIPKHRSNMPDEFYRQATDSSIWGAGGNFTCDCGLDSVLLTERQLACGKAFYIGLSNVDNAQRYQDR